MQTTNTKTLYRLAKKAAERADDRLPHIDDFEERIRVLLAGAKDWLEAAKLAPTEELRADHVRSFKYRLEQADALVDRFGPGSIDAQSRARTLAARKAREDREALLRPYQRAAVLQIVKP